MFQSNIVHSLLKGLDPIHQRTISLTPGQVFSGKIIKLYPGQLASLQLAGMTLTAKLEAALAAGNKYWFQVQPGEGIPELKVLQAQGDLRNTNGNLVKQLGLADTKINNQFIQFLAKEELPFAKNHVVQAVDVLQKTGMANNRGFDIIKILIERNLPITPLTFHAIQSVNSNQSMTNQLHELSQQLQTVRINEPVILQLQERLQSLLTEFNVKVDQHEVVTHLKSFLTENTNSPGFLKAQSELIKLNLMTKDVLPERFVHQFREAVLNSENEPLKLVWPTLSKEEIITHINKNQFSELISKIVIPKGADETRVIQQLFSFFTKSSIATTANEAFSAQFPLKSLMKDIGYQYEKDIAELISSQKENKQLLIQLKSLLIESRHLDLPSIVKEKVDALLHRITGQQLLLVNNDGPITNHLVTLPIKLQGFQTDVTLQWEGKKQKNGQLDPDHCRILFYISLEQLNETIIDVQIQNRIVSLHVINEHQRPNPLISALQPFLKSSLEDMGYHLSSIKWTQPNFEQVSSSDIKTMHSQKTYRPSYHTYQGVDIRI